MFCGSLTKIVSLPGPMHDASNTVKAINTVLKQFIAKQNIPSRKLFITLYVQCQLKIVYFNSELT